MGEVSLARRHTPNQGQGLIDVEMGVVLGETQCVDHQHIDTSQLVDLAVVDSLEIGEVSERPDAETRNGEALGVAALISV